MSAPSLVRSIERMARERGWTDPQLARELDLTPSSWAHIRAGRDAVSLDVLIRIGEVFGPTPAVQRLLAEYLLLDGRAQHPRRRRQSAVATDPLPYSARWRVRRWVARVAAAGGTPQRGLFIHSPDATLLTAALGAVTAEVAAAGLGVATVRPNDRLSASLTSSLLAADLLIVERAEFATEAVKALIHERSNQLKPFVVTSTRDREAITDPHLVRVFRAWTRLVRIGAPALTPSPQPHA